MSLSVELVTSGAAFAAMRSEWTALHDASAAGPFLSWEWLYAAWRRVTPGRALRLLVARDAGGALAGALALCERRELGGACVRSFLGDWTIGSDYLDTLAREDRAAEVREALWTFALGRSGGFDVLELLDLDSDSPSVGVLRRLGAEAGMAVAEQPRYRCPRVAVSGSFEGYLRRLPRAATLRRRRRWLEAQDGFSVSIARTPDEISTAMEEFLTLHRLRWAEVGGSDGVTGPEVEAFHRDAARALAERDMARLYTMSVAGRAIASVYLLRHGDYWAFYQSGYDPSWSRRSPGLVLLAAGLEDAFASGAREVDLLRGSEAYKFEWATGERRTVALRLLASGQAARWWAARDHAGAAARRLAATLLPERWARALRRARQRTHGLLLGGLRCSPA